MSKKKNLHLGFKKWNRWMNELINFKKKKLSRGQNLTWMWQKSKFNYTKSSVSPKSKSSLESTNSKNNLVNRSANSPEM